MIKRIAFLTLLICILMINFNSIVGEEIKDDQINVQRQETVTEPAKKIVTMNPIVESDYDEYKIGIGDVLEISVYPDESMSANVKVGFDGKIGIPKVGEFKVEGQTTSQVDKAVRFVLKKYIKNPEVVVTVKEFNSRKILVFGEVRMPGTFVLPPSTRLLEILTKAGLKDGTADINTITVIHSNGDREVLNISKVISEGDITQNIILKPNDTIYVPELLKELDSEAQAEKETVKVEDKAEEEKPLAFIYVFGEVKKPGRIEYDSDEDLMTVKRALTLAGWYDVNANLESAKVIRANNIQEPVNLNRLIFQADMSQDLLLYPGDSLFLPESKEMGIYILGMVKKPGFFRAKKGMTVLQAISLAQHEKFGALLKETKIVRGWPNRPRVYSVDLKKLLYRGDVAQNMTLKNGDVIFVPETALSNSLDFWNKLLGPITGGLSTAAKIDVLSQPGSPAVDF